MSFKIDLHTHSVLSPDGGTTYEQYKTIIAKSTLNYIAITDHNEIQFAKNLQIELGPKIIVGEEITTKQGDIIGLFLTHKIDSGQNVENAIKDIKTQGGLVYIPHPFETVRSGISEETLERIKSDVDIIEVINGRAFFQNFSLKTKAWAEANSIAQASSSDSHRSGGLGKTYTAISDQPSTSNLLKLLRRSQHVYARPSFFDIMAPKMNRLKKFFRRG